MNNIYYIGKLSNIENNMYIFHPYQLLNEIYIPIINNFHYIHARIIKQQTDNWFKQNIPEEVIELKLINFEVIEYNKLNDIFQYYKYRDRPTNSVSIKRCISDMKPFITYFNPLEKVFNVINGTTTIKMYV